MAPGWGSALSAVACAVALAGCWSEEPRSCADCHVILITVDTLRADHVSSYGYRRDTTPQLDAFFEPATRLERAISGAPCTLPSVRQFLTGRIAPEPSDSRLAETLARAGWDTAAIVSHQFFRGSEGPLPEYARGFDHFDVQPLEQRDLYGMTTRTAAEVSDRALALLEARRSDRPLFLWLHYFDPHDPYAAPPEHGIFEPRTSDTIDGDRRKTMRDGRGRDLPWERRGEIFSDEEERFLVAQYDAEIRYADAQIGRVLSWLSDARWVDESLILLSSDHGERLGEGDKWDHCWSLHQSEMHVPLLARLRGRPLAELRRAEFAASTLDLVPTVLDSLGLAADPAGDGESLLALAEHPQRARERVVQTSWQDQRLAMRGRWKLVVDDTGAAHLFEVAVDPEQRLDRASEHPEIVAELSAGLRATAGGRVRAQSEEVLTRLRALGYLE